MSEVNFFNKFDKKLGATSPALLNDSGAVQAVPPPSLKIFTNYADVFWRDCVLAGSYKTKLLFCFIKS